MLVQKWLEMDKSLNDPLQEGKYQPLYNQEKGFLHLKLRFTNSDASATWQGNSCFIWDKEYHQVDTLQFYVGGDLLTIRVGNWLHFSLSILGYNGVVKDRYSLNHQFKQVKIYSTIMFQELTRALHKELVFIILAFIVEKHQNSDTGIIWYT